MLIIVFKRYIKVYVFYYFKTNIFENKNLFEVFKV